MTLINVVRFLFQLDDDVAGFFPRFVVAVAVEEKPVLAADALVDIDLNIRKENLLRVKLPK